MEGSALETALQCFVAVARHQGIDLSIDRIKHDYALQPDDDITRLLPKIARSSGMRTRKLQVGWKELQRLGDAYPAIARLANGNSVILLGFHEEKVGVLDPLADRLAVMRLDQATFCKKWKGELLLLRRTFALVDESRPFGFAWFIPEVVRNGATFRDIAVAAVMLQILALALPIFIQITVDKVLVHQAYTTLYVLVAGVGVAVLFDAVFNYLRRILLVYASARIDVRTSMRTFERLLSLPIDFFERASAGVITKHMQQVEKIREFLTGRLFLTLLDATSLVVVVPLLFFYSGRLALLVLGFGAALVFDGQITVGALIAFNMLSGRVSAPLAQIVGLVQGYQEAGLSVRMLGQSMNRPPERNPNARGLRPEI